MPETILIVCEEKMEKTLESLKKEVSLIRTGRANPAVLNGVSVNYYGVDTPLNQISSISVPEAQTLMIKPDDKGILNLKDAEDIFAKRKGGSASKLVKGKKSFHLSEVLEYEKPRASYFQNKGTFRTIYKK